MKMIEHNHFICHLILGTFTEYPKFDVGRQWMWLNILYELLFFRDYLIQAGNGIECAWITDIR